eukprot:16313055-Heterocapsa_arctica.AAC.1
MGGASRNPIPALVLGPSGAGYGTGPTPFVRVNDTIPVAGTMPGGGDATGAVPPTMSFGTASGASESTVPVPS